MILTIDFETEAIDNAPDGKAPKPVGLALKRDGSPGIYMGWGHMTGGNNATWEEAKLRLLNYLTFNPTILAHNIGFDAEVALQHLGVDLAGYSWDDTQVMAFHADPHAPSLALKPLATRYLKEPPGEADAVREWLIDAKIVRRSATASWGAHISKAPGSIVGPYAVGDVDRTYRLFKHFKAMTKNEGYRRDILATKVGLKMTRAGVPIDVKGLRTQRGVAEIELTKLCKATAKLLKIDAFDPEDKATLAERIEQVFGIDLPRTATGRRKTAKDTILEALPDGPLKWHLLYISAINYDLKNFLRPWVAATERQPRIHPTWNVTRSDSGGARTGRLSSSPNFQNLRDVEGQHRLMGAIRTVWPKGPHVDLPMIRSFVRAPQGKLLIGRDWSQIELRITGHYEDGLIAEGYRTDEDFDLHQWVVERVDAAFGKTLPRRIAKNIGFGSIYGAGAGALSAQAGITIPEAQEFRDMYFAALPTLKAFIKDVQAVARARPIETLGKRMYSVEPPRMIDGEWRSFEYKMTNYLIQGSAADLMKEAMIQADREGVDLRLTVHDEAVAVCDLKDADEVDNVLREAMEQNDLTARMTVPVTSNGYRCVRWSEAKK